MTEHPETHVSAPRPLPTGVVTLMFTDIEGSSRHWERLDKGFQPVLEEHNRIIREAVEAWEGYEVKTEGDAFMVAFARATDGVCCALDIQRGLEHTEWPPEVGELRVRIGLHTGEPFLGYGSGGNPDYFGPAVNRAARISNAAHGAQIVISHALFEVIQDALSQDIELIDLSVHHLKGLERAETIFQVHHPDLFRREFPPLRTLDLVPHNLPVQMTSFVGREGELTGILSLLRQRTTRVLTLTGPGGVGKTRLSLQAAAECADDYPDGVWFVDLQEVREREGVPAAIADALRIRPQPGTSWSEHLLTVLPHRHLLLVCDNFEQVTVGGSFLAEMLRAAPGVKCLVTSRVPLRLRGERVFEVPPMPQPSPGASVQELSLYDSVALFIERAQEARAGWEVTAANAPAVAELCRRLEGIPLCIELAAARVRGMTPQEILRGLSNRFRLLASPSADLPERQRTLRGAIDWSYDLLTGEERAFLGGLSVFAGGFYAGAVEAVTENAFALDLVLGLQAHSLVVAREEGEKTRFFMLDAIREYAEEKLEMAGNQEAQGIARRHATHYCAFAEERDALVRTPGDAAAMEELNEELENLRAALEWSQAHDPLLCARLAGALRNFFERRGLWDDAHVWAERGLAAARKAGDAHLEAKLLLNLASAHQDGGDLEEARSQAEGSLRLWQQLEDPGGEAAALNLLGLVAYYRDEFPAAADLHQRALQIRRGARDRVGEAMSLHNLGLATYKLEAVPEAERFYQEALAIRRTAGDLRGIAETLCNLGGIAQDRGDDASAQQSFRECLRIWRDFGDPVSIALALTNLGEIAATQGDLARALPLLSVAASTFHRFADHTDSVRDSSGFRRFAEYTDGVLQSLADREDPQSFAELLEKAKATSWEAALRIALDE